ncbi:MAG: hypothetical protein SCH39_10290 [Methanosarcinales archaeon]|nr:hypothetical protein [Methanosarcinales archaeon]
MRNGREMGSGERRRVVRRNADSPINFGCDSEVRSEEQTGLEDW